MLRVLLINPNASVATTEMMVAIARKAAGERFAVTGATVPHGPPMIVDPDALAAAGPKVVAIARAHADACDGIIVAAFGDPGLTEIRAGGMPPAVGIAEAAMLEAAGGGRRFGVATTTPRLVAGIDASVALLGLADRYAGTRVTPGDPHALVADPARLDAALAAIVRACIAEDGAAAVIIGGGPLGQAAQRLQPLFTEPIIAPIPAAVSQLAARLTLR